MLRRLSLSLFMLLTVFAASVTGLKLNAANTNKIKGPSFIQKERLQVLTLSDILALYSSELGGVSIQSDYYTGNGAIVGIYEIELIASNGLEQATKLIEIEVLNVIGFKVRAVTDQVNIHISKANKLNPLDIISIHSKTGVVSLNQTSQMEILSDSYSANYNEAGTYIFEYRLMDASGIDKTVSCSITVYDSERLQNPITVIPPRERSPFFKKLGSTITSILVLAAAIFIGLFTFRLVRRKLKK